METAVGKVLSFAMQRREDGKNARMQMQRIEMIVSDG